MKSNYQSTPIEHLENRRPKCKLHTQERQLTRFCILQLIYKEKRTGFFPKPNRNQTELEKSIPHIPNLNQFCMLVVWWCGGTTARVSD